MTDLYLVVPAARLPVALLLAAASGVQCSLADVRRNRAGTLAVVRVANVRNPALLAAEYDARSLAVAGAAPTAHAASHAAGQSDALTPTALGLAADAISDQLLDAQDGVLVLEQYAPFACTLTSLRIIATAGTCTVAVAIDGTPVTGLDAVAVSTVEAAATATAANTVAAGATITLTISAAAGLGNVAWSLARTR